MTQRHTLSLLALVTAALAAPACKKNTMGDDATNVAGGYEDTKYRENIVTGRERREYADQGKGVSPKVLAAIDHTIRNVYERDFKHCMEEEMDRQNSRFVRAVYSIEFDIDTAGKVKEAKILSMSGGKQDARGANLGPIDTTQLAECIHTAVMGWEFDDKPEVEFRHTYRGQVGEAF
jgi:hypothetical protein